MRLFTAIALPDTVSACLLGLQHDLPGARWRGRDTMHLTLCFFGEVQLVRSDELRAELGRIDAPGLSLTLAQGGVFGGRKPRALWVAVENNPTLTELAGACARAARKVGLTPPHKRYLPHVTLAYCRGTRDVHAARFLERLSGFSIPPFRVDHFNLYRSELGAHPARHTIEAQYPMR